MTTTNFVPILLGSDINVYGMARAFHEKYDIKSYAYCHVPLAPTKYSKIVDVTVVEGIDTVAGFVPALKVVKAKHQADLDAGKQLLLIPCGDVYSEILSETQDDVRSTFGDDFTFTIIPFEMLQKLINK
jgi:D-aspartate ligase